MLGAVVLWRQDWRLALLLTLWAVPNLLLYTAYYWAPDNATSIGYLRFTLTVFPALATAAVVGVRWVAAARGVLGTVAAGLVVAVGCGAGLYAALENVSIESATNRATLRGAEAIKAVAPAGSVVLGPDRMLNFLQLAGDYQLYDTTQFERRFVQQMGKVDPDAPTGLQPQRAAAIYAAHKDDSEQQLLAEEIKLVADAQAAGRRVFVLDASTGRSSPVDRLIARGRFVARVAGGWDETPEERLRAKRKGVGNGAKAAARLAGGAVAWQVVELKPPVAAARRGQIRSPKLEFRNKRK